jgi:AcrR family transcriptional regulator
MVNERGGPRRPPGRPRKVPVAVREQLVLDAAVVVFGERGPGGGSIDAVAARAGVNKALVYEHIASKDELFRTVVVRERDRLVAYLAASYERTGDLPLRDRVRSRFHAFVDFAGDHPDSLRLLALPEATTALAAAGRGTATEDLARSLRPELERAGLPANELPEVLAAMIVGASGELIRLSGPAGWDPEAVVDLLTEFTLAGLRGVDRAVFERVDRPRPDA